jgi:hypothetical protein
VKPGTRDYLARAARNRDLAIALVDRSAVLGTEPPLDWAVVIAFYAAVHFVNGYLWEKQDYEPASHDQRETALNRVLGLRAVSLPYARLRTLGFQARYQPRFRLTRVTAEEAVRVNLPTVEQTILTALRDAT